MTLSAEPAAFEVRAASYDDVEAITTMLDTTTRTWVGRPTSVDDVRDRLETPNTTITSDTAVAVLPAGDVVGFGHCWPAQLGEVRCFARTHPAHVGIGVGTALQRRLLDRARAHVPADPADRSWQVTTTSWAGDVDAAAVLDATGYTAVRYYQRMLLDLPGWVAEDIDTPAGLSLRTVRPGDDEALFAAFVEAFAEHWGEEHPDPVTWWHDRREAAIASYDPELWLLAVDGDEIAGFALALLREDAEGQAFGLVGDLGVRPGWRGRGLGEVLLIRSLLRLRDRGLPYAALDVDTENITGAVRLYMKVGMTSHPSFTIWSQPLAGP